MFFSSASFNEFSGFNESAVVEEEDDDEFMSNLQPKLNDNESANDDTALTAEVSFCQCTEFCRCSERTNSSKLTLNLGNQKSDSIRHFTR